MGLFGSKTDLAITLDTDIVTAGGEVRATVEVGEADKKAQGGRVELLYKNTYKEEYRDSDGDRSTRTTSEDVVVDAVHLEELEAGARQVTLTVPPDASGNDAKAVEWRVQAVVDRKRARDARAEQAIHVHGGEDVLAGWAERAPSRPKECDVVLEPSTRIVQPGDRITGTVTFRATREALSGRALRVDLHRVLEDRDDLTDEATVKAELSSSVDLAVGEEERLTFEVVVPEDAGPSFRAKHNAQHWYLEGVVDRPRARDYVGRVELLVL